MDAFSDANAFNGTNSGQNAEAEPREDESQRQEAAPEMCIGEEELPQPSPENHAKPEAHGIYAKFKRAAKKLKRRVLALYYACQDPSVGWVPKALGAFAIAYALSPMDLVPDFIPILGILDDLILLPGLIYLAIWLIPEEAWKRAEERAVNEPLTLSKNWVAAALVFLIWDIALLAVVHLLIVHFGGTRVKAKESWILVPILIVIVASEAAWSILTVRGEKTAAMQKLQDTREEAALEDPLLIEPAQGARDEAV